MYIYGWMDGWMLLLLMIFLYVSGDVYYLLFTLQNEWRLHKGLFLCVWFLGFRMMGRRIESCCPHHPLSWTMLNWTQRIQYIRYNYSFLFKNFYLVIYYSRTTRTTRIRPQAHTHTRINIQISLFCLFLFCFFKLFIF